MQNNKLANFRLIDILIYAIFGVFIFMVITVIFPVFIRSFCFILLISMALVCCGVLSVRLLNLKNKDIEVILMVIATIILIPTVPILLAKVFGKQLFTVLLACDFWLRVLVTVLLTFLAYYQNKVKTIEPLTTAESAKLGELAAGVVFKFLEGGALDIVLKKKRTRTPRLFKKSRKRRYW